MIWKRKINHAASVDPLHQGRNVGLKLATLYRPAAQMFVKSRVFLKISDRVKMPLHSILESDL